MEQLSSSKHTYQTLISTNTGSFSTQAKHNKYSGPWLYCTSNSFVSFLLSSSIQTILLAEIDRAALEVYDTEMGRLAPRLAQHVSSYQHKLHKLHSSLIFFINTMPSRIGWVFTFHVIKRKSCRSFSWNVCRLSSCPSLLVALFGS